MRTAVVRGLVAGGVVVVAAAVATAALQGGVPPRGAAGGGAKGADAHAQIVEEYFELADHDGSGWISFQEAQDALGLDRDEFARFDTDRDGRIQREEFEERYRDIISRGSVFPRPRGPALPPAPPPRTADGLLDAYDRDFNEALSRDELAELVKDYRLAGTSAALLLSQYDEDGSGRLERTELVYVAELLRARTAVDAPIEPGTVTSLEDLFGKPIERVRSLGTVPLPPRIAGPVRPFTRLDLDGDGSIGVRDLERAQFPLTLAVRPATVIAALDRDGDGALSPEELRLAFEAPARAD